MKAFLGNLFRNKNLVTIIAGIVCTVIIMVAYNYRVNQITKPVSVPYAAVDIYAREEVTEDKVKTIKMAASMVTNTVIRNKNDVIGKFVNYNTMIPAGSLFYQSALVDWSNMPDSAWSNIKEGYTIVSLGVNVNTTYGNSIFPKDKIDLYYKTIDSNGKLVLGKLIEGIEVLAVKDEGGNHIFKKAPNQKQAAALIFAVSEDMHLLLRKASYLDGEIIPVPRNADYGESPTISSNYLKSLILSKTIEVPLDSNNSSNTTTDNNTNNNTNNNQ